MDITSAAWRSLCNPLPRFFVWNRTLGAFRPVLQRAERLMCFWRWWQIQSLDFTWLNEERNSVMHQRKRPSFSPELSQAWGHYVNHTLSPSESRVKTCHSKYLSPILGLFLREAAFFEKKKNDLFSVISKEHVVSNEHNLLSFCWLFSFKNKEETYFPCFLYSLWHFKLLQTYFLLHIFLRKKCHKFALILLDLTCVEILHDAKPVLRITGTRGRNIKGESCKDAISAACVSLKYVYFPFSGPF